jgi:hypothetical protein
MITFFGNPSQFRIELGRIGGTKQVPFQLKKIIKPEFAIVDPDAYF